MQIKSKSGRVFDLPSDVEAQTIHAGIEADEDTFTLDQFKRMRQSGQPQRPVRKRPVSIRLSPEVLSYFKSTGKGWQGRLDEVLKAYVAERR